MDLRLAPEAVQQREAVDRALSQINTSIPGVIISWNSETQRASVRPAIQAIVNIDGEKTFRDHPVIPNCPLTFSYAVGAGLAITIPISVGDPCLILFSQRALDNWLDKGGIQPPESNSVCVRHHDLTDAMAIPTIIPLKNKLPDWSNEAIEIRNFDRTIRVSIFTDRIETFAGGSEQIIKNDGTVVINCSNAKINATGKAEVSAPSIELKNSGSALKKLINETFIQLYNSHTHGSSPAPAQQANINDHATGTVKAE